MKSGYQTRSPGHKPESHAQFDRGQNRRAQQYMGDAATAFCPRLRQLQLVPSCVTVRNDQAAQHLSLGVSADEEWRVCCATLNKQLPTGSSGAIDHIRGVVSTPGYIAPPYRRGNGDPVSRTATQPQERTLGNGLPDLISLLKNLPSIFIHSFHQQMHARTSQGKLPTKLGPVSFLSFPYSVRDKPFSFSFLYNRKIPVQCPVDELKMP